MTSQPTQRFHTTATDYLLIPEKDLQPHICSLIREIPDVSMAIFSTNNTQKSISKLCNILSVPHKLQKCQPASAGERPEDLDATEGNGWLLEGQVFCRCPETQVHQAAGCCGVSTAKCLCLSVAAAESAVAKTSALCATARTAQELSPAD